MVGIYGQGWKDWGTDAVYWRLEADRMFTFHMDASGLSEPAADESRM
jgi:hypothetical protein